MARNAAHVAIGGMLLATQFAGALPAADPHAAERERMVREQIAGRGIRNPGVLAAMRAIPRHVFVPEELHLLAYADRPLPIGREATISQPYIVALMTELLDPARHHRVLEIGTGSGYQAAVLGRLASHVYTVEIVPELGSSARERLRALGYGNITVRIGDGYQGWAEEAPFDRIIVTAAPEDVPSALIGQLRPGGRLVAPVGVLGSQELIVLEKDGNGRTRRRTVAPVAFVPMRPGRR